VGACAGLCGDRCGDPPDVDNDSGKVREMSKSYWQDCFIHSPGAQSAVKSWFSPLLDDMTITKAELLCDIETDAEKKMRVFANTPEGRKYRLIRARTVRGFTIAMKALP
jgi:hypothetical protein